MPSRDFPNDALGNEDVIEFLSSEELKELHKLNGMRRSLAAIINHFEEREGAIFSAARSRQGGDNVPVA